MFSNRRFHGIGYFCGHDPSQREIAIALFGDAGEAAWPAVATTPVLDDIVRAAGRRFGIQVLPTP